VCVSLPYPALPCLAPGANATTPLWQLQLCGNNKGAFAFRVLTVVKDALLQHPNADVRALRDLETVLQLRLIVGSPAQAGPSDPDAVGFVDWEVAMYCSNVANALDFIHFILDFKVQHGYVAGMPDLLLHAVDVGTGLLPSPWRVLSDPAFIPPEPFRVMPPKGRRHVIAQLEKNEDGVDDPAESNDENDKNAANGAATKQEDDAPYTLSFWGCIYHFKERFEAKGIPGSLVPIKSQEHKDYVRYLKVSLDDEGKKQVELVLEDILKGMPVYFINAAGEDDPMAAWLQQQPSIFQKETSTVG